MELWNAEDESKRIRIPTVRLDMASAKLHAGCLLRLSAKVKWRLSAKVEFCVLLEFNVRFQPRWYSAMRV